MVFGSEPGGEPEREAGREAAMLGALPLLRVAAELVPLGAMSKNE